MRKFVSRAAVIAACSLGLTMGLGGTASAEELRISVLKGCWGSGDTTLCDWTLVVRYDADNAVYTYTWQAEVCTGTCSYTTLPWVGLTGQNPDLRDVCLEYRNRYEWWSSEECYL